MLLVFCWVGLPGWFVEENMVRLPMATVTNFLGLGRVTRVVYGGKQRQLSQIFQDEHKICIPHLKNLKSFFKFSFFWSNLENVHTPMKCQYTIWKRRVSLKYGIQTIRCFFNSLDFIVAICIFELSNAEMKFKQLITEINSLDAALHHIHIIIFYYFVILYHWSLCPSVYFF